MGNNFQEKENNNFNAALCITIFYESRAPEKCNLNNFNKQRISLGRRTDNDIVINSPITSGNHHIEFVILKNNIFTKFKFILSDISLKTNKMEEFL